MLSNFLYTVALVIIIFFGKDTANQFIDSFREEPEVKHIEEQKNNKEEIIEGEFEELDKKELDNSE